MYKQKLQELCQQKRWAVPKYTWAKDGPDHNPRFRASVVVVGETFDASAGANFRSAKEVQNDASRVAFYHFTSNSGSLSAKTDATENSPKNAVLESSEVQVNFSTSLVDKDAREMQYPFKNQLLCYAQRRNMDLPLYDVVREGPLHALRFKASVTVDGQTFESQQFFSTLKDAEHAAAKVALMTLSEEGNQEVETGFYKNLLQELAQKERLSMPTYKTVKDGPPHMPTFISTVEIEGESVEGSAAKTKKEAEMKAAKVAWARLRERRLSRLPADISSSLQMLDIDDAFSNSQSTVTVASHLPSVLSVANNDCNIHTDKGNSSSADGNSAAGPQKPDTVVTAKEGQSFSSSSSGSVNACSKDTLPTESMLSNEGISPSSSQYECSDITFTDVDTELPIERSTSSVLCNRVRVYPRKPNMQFPQGTTLLPYSDNMWVAVSVDSSNHEVIEAAISV